MTRVYFINFLNLLINALMLLIFIRVLISWIPASLGTFRKVITELTEPIMAPFRKLIPPIGGIDITPLIVFIVLQLIQGLIARF